MHGEASAIRHEGHGVLAGVPDGFNAGRYHSLIVELDGDEPLTVTARSEDGEIMGLEHKTHPTFGVQFHPESVLTEHGYDILRNFLKRTR
jgi:anthranilate synthase component 2/para-aminobenzoate synthetase component 2